MSLMDGRRQGYRQSRSGSHDGHDHDHGDVFHSHAPVGKMKVAFLLTLFILVVEFAGGLLSHSLALLSDAGHVLTDIAALGLSWYALRQAEKPSDERMTFGYHRSGILAALINGISLMLITLWILWEAFQRFQHPQPVQSAWMFAGAGVGLALNLYLGLGMHKDDNINVKSAVMHMLGDAAASAGVIAGGCVMLATKWYVVDPILSVLIAALIAFGAWRIVRQTLVVLMEGTPRGVSFQSVVEEIKTVTGVQEVHDVHMWCIASGRNALSCHLVLDGTLTIREGQSILRDLEHRLAHLGIGHVTIQMEDADHPHEQSEFCAAPESVHEH